MDTTRVSNEEAVEEPSRWITHKRVQHDARCLSQANGGTQKALPNGRRPLRYALLAAA